MIALFVWMSRELELVVAGKHCHSVDWRERASKCYPKVPK